MFEAENADSKFPRIVVLISGSGSNMQAIAESVQKGEIPAEMAGVISNRPNVLGLERAESMNIPNEVLDHKDFDSREEFDIQLIRRIEDYEPDLVVLAGFMRILTEKFTRYFEGRMINIHPSLLPKYQGLNTHKRAIEDGEKEHGVTVHFVTEELDGGPSIIQAVVPILDDDSPDSLQKRVQQQEHIIFPIAVKWFCEGRITMDNGKATLDSQELPISGVQLRD